MQLINLRQRPAAIDLIAPWHFVEWGALFPDHSLADFAAELALCLTDQHLPATWLLLYHAGDMVGTGSLLPAFFKLVVNMDRFKRPVFLLF